MQFCSTTQRLYELREGDGGARLHTWDLTRGQHVADISEFFTSYELSCGPLQLDDAGNELMCGATHGSKHLDHKR